MIQADNRSITEPEDLLQIGPEPGRRLPPRATLALVVVALCAAGAAVFVLAHRTHDAKPRAAAPPFTPRISRPATPPATVEHNEYCVGQLTCPAGSIPAALHRTLRRPRVINHRCSPAPERRVDPTVGAAGGAGPVFSVTGDPRHHSTVSMTFPPDPRGVFAGSRFSGQKVLWVIVAGYHGPVLIRGSGLNASSPLRFSTTDGPLQSEVRLPREPATAPARYTDTYVRVREPGCYDWQVDGVTFSYTITFRVVAGS
jgi:hypothetical protein